MVVLLAKNRSLEKQKLAMVLKTLIWSFSLISYGMRQKSSVYIFYAANYKLTKFEAILQKKARSSRQLQENISFEYLHSHIEIERYVICCFLSKNYKLNKHIKLQI